MCILHVIVQVAHLLVCCSDLSLCPDYDAAVEKLGMQGLFPSYLEIMKETQDGVGNGAWCVT